MTASESWGASIFRYSTDYHGQLVAVQILPLTIRIFLWSIVVMAAFYAIRRAAGVPVQRAAAVPAGAGSVERYEVGARLYHWGGVFVLMAALAASGLALYAPGTMPEAPLSWLRLHELFAGLFIIGVLLHIGFSLTQGEARSMWFERRDWKDLSQMSGYLFGRRGDYPHFGKYDVIQKLYHFALAVFVAALIVSGALLSLNAEVLVTFSHNRMRWQRLIHDTSSLAVIGMVMAHAYLRLLKANWPTLVAMFTGSVPKAYFRRHHDYQRWTPRERDKRDREDQLGSREKEPARDEAETDEIDQPHASALVDR